MAFMCITVRIIALEEFEMVPGELAPQTADLRIAARIRVPERPNFGFVHR
jgi:hypothetical protein